MKLRILFALSIFSALTAVSSLRAQLGNGNPTGPSGFFSGNITTGCSYDAFTGNAMRAITDLVVPGGVGSYPLAFSRTANSREAGSQQFGLAGRWRHSYQWEIDGEDNRTSSSFQPTYYSVHFPDGRIINFTYRSSDIYFRGPAGVKERFQPLNTTTLLAYLILPDGGKVEFKATRHSDCDPELIPPCTYSYSYQAQAIIDPHGLRTTLVYNGDETLNTVTDASGRWIQLLYVTTPWTNGYGYADRVIDHITSSDGRSVKYNYGLQAFSPGTTSFTYLGNVVYYGDSTLIAVYTYQAPNVGSANLWPLLSTCNDPMYDGPMKKITYDYATGVNGDNSTAVVGQIESEKSGTPGQTVSNLGIINNGRVETKGSGGNRYFTYGSTQIQSWSDYITPFSNRTVKGYDTTTGFISSIQDPNGNTTNFACDARTGNVNLVTHPLTPPDATRATVAYTYGSATCPDPNNRDANNPYYLYSVKDERDFVTTYLRDTNKRVTRINYPDGGYETFAYSPLGQVASHRLRTGGLETFTYDGSGRLTEYRDAYHLATVDSQNPSVPASATPSLSYTYYPTGAWFDRLKTITDANGNVSTVSTYNTRGQATKVTHQDGNYVQSAYNADGTLQWKQDELNHRTSYTYDDYKRVLSVTLPAPRVGDPNPPQTFYYDHTGGSSTADYTHTDANPTRITLPSGTMTSVGYDANGRKTSSTLMGPYGTGEHAITTFTYDYNGNVETVKDPNGQTTGLLTKYFYDERNRLTDVDDPMLNDAAAPHRNSNGHTTSWTYDFAGNTKSQKNANNQLISFDEYDEMNRLLQQTVQQNPDPVAVTKYTYYPSGLLDTMQDPKLVETPSSSYYKTSYDLMGRKTRLAYPPEPGGALRSEWFTYDAAGNLETYSNRGGFKQTFVYDGRNRQISSAWSDGTTALTFTYDAASRVTQITNADAVINNTYYDDNTLKIQEEWATAAPAYHHSVIYDYNLDRNRSYVAYPSGKSYNYTYTGRNQLAWIQDNLDPTGIHEVSYDYDLSGNVETRRAGNNGIVTDASQRNPMNQIKHLEHRFAAGSAAPATRSFDYTYNSMGNRSTIKRDTALAQSYGYDYAQQVTLGVESGVSATYSYDANGNRDALNASTAYATNILNQQTTFNGQTVIYNAQGNVTSLSGTATYAYDAMGRLTKVINGGVTSTFKYDGLNRKISQTVAGVTTYNVWDGWNLIEERNATNGTLYAYLYGTGEIVSRITYPSATKRLYFQDGLGSTSHLSDEAGILKEAYRYGTFGQTTIMNPAGAVISSSAEDVRHLYTGQLWMLAAGLYDYRYRAYSPTLTRFLQPDPIGFAGDPSNLYRYCGNNPLNWTDPSGLHHDPLEEPTMEVILNMKTDEDSRAGAAWQFGLIVRQIFQAIFPPLSPVYYVPPTGSNIPVAPGQPVPTAPPPPAWPSSTPPPPPPLQPPRPIIYPGAPIIPEIRSGGGGGENRTSSDGGNSSPFSPNGNSFTTAEGNSPFNFNVDLSQAGYDAYNAAPTGNPAGGGGTLLTKKKH